MSTRVLQRRMRRDGKLLQSLQEGGNEWKNRQQLTRLMGVTLTTTHFEALNRLEIERLIEIRQGKNKIGTMRWEYRAVTNNKNGSKG